MKLYGIIGYPLAHSFSKKYYTEKFIREQLNDCRYETFPLQSIEEIENVLKQPDLKGFNVTIPYKEKVMRYLDEVSDAVKNIGACNCVKIWKGKLYGFNSDVIGFEKSFVPHLQSHHTKALILGTGGASKAVQYVLKKLNIPFLLVSRNENLPDIISYPSLNENILNDYYIVINTTPVGTFPNVDDCPQIPFHLIGKKHYLYDLIYNPPETMFIKKGNAQGAFTKNGYEMLILQAEENWKTWNSETTV